jgi:hypothetical protein
MPTAKKPEPPKKLVGRGSALRDPETREAATQGLREQRAIEAYLRFLADPPKSYRGLSVEDIDAKIGAESSLARKAILIAQRHQAATDIAAREHSRASREALEDGFVKHAGTFSTRHNITYSVWREMGVPPAALRRAGMRAPYEGKAKDLSKVTSRGEPRKKPYKTRRVLTPEFLAQVLSTYEVNGGGRTGIKAVAEQYDYVMTHAANLVKKAQKAHWTGGLTIREAAD